MPLADITNCQRGVSLLGGPGPGPKLRDIKPVAPLVHRHNPYEWQCLIEETPLEVFMESELRAQACRTAADTPSAAATSCAPPTSATAHTLLLGNATESLLPSASALYHDVLVEFKCHADVYKCTSDVSTGQYVVVSGDRGIDVGVVTRLAESPDAGAHTTEKLWSCKEVLRRASQKEVDFWSLDLKEMEDNALKTCQKMVRKIDLLMEVVQAEYQFDCKKLTFYYTAHNRVDFVQLLKDLYREFGCRIWMEKVRARDG